MSMQIHGVAVPDLLLSAENERPDLVCTLQKTSSEQVPKMSPTLDWVEPGDSVDPVQGVYGRHASSSVEHLGSDLIQRSLLDEVKHLPGTSTSPTAQYFSTKRLSAKYEYNSI